MKNKKIVIGRSDEADFPEIGLYNEPVKIDSGAYTSSIHYYKVNEIEEGGEIKLRCYFYAPRTKNYKNGIIDFKNFETKKVKSSNGESQLRYRIKTKIKLFGKTYTIYLTLAKRSKMKFNVLIGRKFLNRKFVIDTTAKNLSKNNTIKYYTDIR